MNGPERPVEFMVRFCGEFLYLSQIQHHAWIVLKPYTVNLGTLVGIQVRQKDNMFAGTVVLGTLFPVSRIEPCKELNSNHAKQKR